MSEETRTRRLLVFVICGLIALALVVLGTRVLNGRVTQTSPESEPVTVETMPVQGVDSFTIIRRFAARAEPRRQADLAFETPGVITHVNVDEGDRVRNGAVVARIDSRSLAAMRTQQVATLRSLESDLELAQLALNRQQNLEDNGFSAAEALDEARLAQEKVNAAIAQANAALNSIDIQIDKSAITAPFDGIIGRRGLDIGSTVTPSQSVLTLYDSAQPYVRVGIPPDVIPALTEMTSVTLSTNNRTVSARIASIRPDMDIQTRTVSVLLEPDADNETGLFFGQLLELKLDQRVAAEAFPIPLSALREGERGLWSVLIVVPDEDSDELVVQSVAVSIIHANTDTAFVTGSLTDGAPLITVGRHRVVPGERVQLASPES